MRSRNKHASRKRPTFRKNINEWPLIFWFANSSGNIKRSSSFKPQILSMKKNTLSFDSSLRFNILLLILHLLILTLLDYSHSFVCSLRSNTPSRSLFNIHLFLVLSLILPLLSAFSTRTLSSSSGLFLLHSLLISPLDLISIENFLSRVDDLILKLLN